MISQSLEIQSAERPAAVALVRYGRVPQVARFVVDAQLCHTIGSRLVRNASVIVETDRGLEMGQLLQVIRDGVQDADKPSTGSLLRIATDADRTAACTHEERANREFGPWQQRVADWQLQLQLIDLEWTLDDQKLILYVLNGQNAETTRLALLAAAAGLGIVHVQPVAAEGIVSAEPSGGCGSGGCGSGGCH